MASTSSNDRNKITASDRNKLIEIRRSLLYPPLSPSVEEVMGNNDLLILILLRLPARYLVRFKLVNRRWRSLISGTKFAREHFGVNPKPPISGLYYRFHPYPLPLQGHSLPMFAFIGKPEQSQEGFFRIHDSRHGLILCSYTYKTLADYSLQIVVCNPTTQKHRFFPEMVVLKKHGRMYSPCHFYLSFDPSVSLNYKLIYISKNKLEYDVVIYTSDYSNQKIIHLEADQLWGHLLKHGLLASDGIIYIMTTNKFLVEFDVEKEKLSAARMTNNMMVEYFGENDAGNLVGIVSQESGLEIYEMAKLEGRKWVKKHHIDLTRELQNLPLPKQNIEVLYMFWDDENEERDLNLVLSVSGKAILYKHNKKETKLICDLPACHPPDRRVHPFIGSLCAI